RKMEDRKITELIFLSSIFLSSIFLSSIFLSSIFLSAGLDDRNNDQSPICKIRGLFSRRPAYRIPHQPLIIRIQIGVAVVAELYVNDARFFIRADPGDRFVAQRVIGLQQYLHLRRNPQAFVCLIPDAEGANAFGDRMLAHWLNRNLFVVFVA